MRKIRYNNIGSSNAVIIFVIILAITSLLLLVLGSVVEPFMNLMDSSDSSIHADVSEPRGFVFSLMQVIFPKGILLVVFFGSSMAVFFEYQKHRYKTGGN